MRAPLAYGPRMLNNKIQSATFFCEAVQHAMASRDTCCCVGLSRRSNNHYHTEVRHSLPGEQHQDRSRVPVSPQSMRAYTWKLHCGERP